MKKFAIACAVVLAACLSSCGDTNYCYEITMKYPFLGDTKTESFYVWGTSNEIDAFVDAKKEAFEKLGIDNKDLQISRTRTSKSQSDCHK